MRFFETVPPPTTLSSSAGAEPLFEVRLKIMETGPEVLGEVKDVGLYRGIIRPDELSTSITIVYVINWRFSAFVGMVSTNTGDLADSSRLK